MLHLNSFNCYLLDFDDSFTFNIASYYYQLGFKLEVIPLSEATKFLNHFVCDQKTLFIYGPGPGTINDYNHLFPVIKKQLENPLIYHLGICLGHQLLWGVLGVETIRSRNPIHGESVPFQIPCWNCFSTSSWGRSYLVQRYNSLTPNIPPHLRDYLGKKVAYIDQECMASFGERWLTYQFHPESVATEANMLFLEPPLTFFV